MHLIDELTKNYGPVDVIWFDGTDPVPYDKGKYATDAIPPMVYSRNPNTMLGTHGAVKEDFISFEHMVGGFDRVKPWKICEAINPSGWVYNRSLSCSKICYVQWYTLYAEMATTCLIWDRWKRENCTHLM